MSIDEPISCFTCWTRLVSFHAKRVCRRLARIPANGIGAAIRPNRCSRPSVSSKADLLGYYSLYSGVIATHAADWASTEQCLRTSQQQEKAGLVGLCHEGLLPSALAESKAGLGAYEATTAALEVYSQYLVTKHHHQRIARIAQLANIGATAYVVAHNYHTIQAATRP